MLIKKHTNIKKNQTKAQKHKNQMSSHLILFKNALFV